MTINDKANNQISRKKLNNFQVNRNAVSLLYDKAERKGKIPWWCYSQYKVMKVGLIEIRNCGATTFLIRRYRLSFKTNLLYTPQPNTTFGSSSNFAVFSSQSFFAHTTKLIVLFIYFFLLRCSFARVLKVLVLSLAKILKKLAICQLLLYNPMKMPKENSQHLFNVMKLVVCIFLLFFFQAVGVMIK